MAADKPVKVALPLIPIACPAPPSTETVYPFGSRSEPDVLAVAVRLPGGVVVDGLSAITVASHVFGCVKFQVHRGSTEPALVGTA